MRGARLPHPALAVRLSLAVLLALAVALTAAPWAQARNPAPKAETAKAQPKGQKPQPKGQKVDILGRVAVGLDKTFIKDQSQGYFLVQGLDLTRFAGRHIQGKGVVVGQEREFRVIRLLDYSIKSPDDDSPGTAAPKKK